MITNHPDKWVIVEISDGNQSFRKILSSWYGGYLGSDSWRLSSMIVSTNESEAEYHFTTETSSYVCNKKAVGMNLIASGVLNDLIEKAKLSNTEVKVVDYDM
jgi:hypothetical protein